MSIFPIKNEWLQNSFQFLMTFPSISYKDPAVLRTAVYVSVNAVFFKIFNDFAVDIEKNLNKTPDRLDKDSLIFNKLLVNVVVVGVSFLVYNIILLKLFDYAINKYNLLVVTTIVILARWVFFSIPIKNVVSSDQNKSVAPNNLKRSPRNNHNIRGADASRGYKLSDESIPQNSFIDTFCNEMHYILNNTFKKVVFSQEQIKAQELILKELRKGVFVFKGQRDQCLAVSMTIQAAFEKYLFTSMSMEDVTEVKVLFLSELPYKPLCSPLKKIEAEAELKLKNGLEDIRIETVKKLQEKVAQLFVCYQSPNYQTLVSKISPLKSEYEMYEMVKKGKSIVDTPLPMIAKELMGSVYILKDNKKKSYTFISEEVQTKDDDNEAMETSWKVWFGPSESHDIKERTDAILSLINN